MELVCSISDFPDILVNLTVATLSLSEYWILGSMENSRMGVL